MAVLVIDSLQDCCQYTQMCVTPQVMTHLGTAGNLNHGHILAEKEITIQSSNAECTFCYCQSYGNPQYGVHIKHFIVNELVNKLHFVTDYNHTGPQSSMNYLKQPMQHKMNMRSGT